MQLFSRSIVMEAEIAGCATAALVAAFVKAVSLCDRDEVSDLVTLQLIHPVYSIHKNIRFHLWQSKD